MKTITDADFKLWIAQQLPNYLIHDDFKRRCADVVAAQSEGRCLTLNELAAALQVPLEFCDAMVIETARRFQPSIWVDPETGGGGTDPLPRVH